MLGRKLQKSQISTPIDYDNARNPLTLRGAKAEFSRIFSDSGMPKSLLDVSWGAAHGCARHLIWASSRCDDEQACRGGRVSTARTGIAKANVVLRRGPEGASQRGVSEDGQAGTISSDLACAGKYLFFGD